MKLETGSIIAALLLAGCGASSVHVKNPESAIDRWNAAASTGDCEQMGQMLHPARYERVAVDTFVTYCEELDSDRRSELLAVTTDSEGSVFAELSDDTTTQRSVALKLTSEGWRISEFDRGANLGTDPISVFQQLQALASSDVLAQTIAVMEPQARTQYTEELSLLRDALSANQLADIEIHGDQAVVSFEIVTITLRRGADGRWYFSSMQPGGSSGYY